MFGEAGLGFFMLFLWIRRMPATVSPFLLISSPEYDEFCFNDRLSGNALQCYGLIATIYLKFFLRCSGLINQTDGTVFFIAHYPMLLSRALLVLLAVEIWFITSLISHGDEPAWLNVTTGKGHYVNQKIQPLVTQ